MRPFVFAVLWWWATAGLGHAADVDLQPRGTYREVRIEHAPAWRAASQMAFTMPLGLAGAGPLYARIVYLDRGEGLLRVSYASKDGMVALA